MFKKYDDQLKKYSEECNHFLKSVIIWEFEKRLTSKECLLHPWIQKNCTEARKMIEKNIESKKSKKNTNYKKKTSKRGVSNSMNIFKSWFNELNKTRSSIG